MKNKREVSTQDEAGLATGWVSPAGGDDDVGVSRWGGRLCRLLLLVLLLIFCLILRALYRSHERTTRLRTAKAEGVIATNAFTDRFWMTAYLIRVKHL